MPEPMSAAATVGPPPGPFAVLPPRPLTAADPRSLLHARFGLQPLLAASIATLSPAQAEQGSAAVAGRSVSAGGGGTAAPSVLSPPSQWGHSRSASGTVTPSVQSVSRSTMMQAGPSRTAQRSASPPAAGGSGSGQAPPLSPASPLAFQRALGLEKRTEAGLVALLMNLASAPPPTNTKVSEPKSGALLAAADAAASLATPPPTPPAANDPQWQRSATCARMAAGAGRDPNALLQAEERLNAAAIGVAAGAPLVRLTRTLLAALPPALRRDPRWQSPFVSPPGHAHPISPSSSSASHAQSGQHAPADSPGLAALRAMWDSEEAEEGPRGLAGSASLAQLDPSSSSRLRAHAFRTGVRAALLTARSEKQFHRQVEMIAAATGAVAPRITAGSPAAAAGPAVDPARLYPFLKLWTRLSALDRRTGMKRALKAQLDGLQHHPYYTAHAFGDQREPRNRAAYAAWIKAQALRLHSQMLALSDEIAELKSAQSLSKNLRPVANLFRSCFGLCAREDPALNTGEDAGEEGPESMTLSVSRGRTARSSSGDEDLWSYAPSRLEDPRSSSAGGAGTGLVEPPRPDEPPKRFGQRSARAAAEKSRRAEERAQRRGERARRNEARRSRRVLARHGSGSSPSPCAESLSASEPDSPSAPSSSDTEWERTEAQARERELYRARQAQVLQARRAWEQAVRRANDTRGVLRDMGLDEDDEGLNGNGSGKKPKKQKKKTPAAALSPREAGYGPRSPGAKPRGAPASSPAAAASSPTSVAGGNGASYGSVDSASGVAVAGGASNEGDQSHALYAVLLWSLLRLEPDCDSAAAAASAAASAANSVGAGSGGPQPPSRRSSQAGSTLMVPSLSQVGFLGSSSSGAAAARPFQAVHTTRPSMNESFNPVLCPSARGLLDAFSSALGVGGVFCHLQMLHVLVSNLQRTESYWIVARQTLQALADAGGGAGGAGGGGWTRLEVVTHVVYLERMLQWSAQCATNFGAVFALQVDAHKQANANANKDAEGEDDAAATAASTSTDGAHQSPLAASASASPGSERKRGSVSGAKKGKAPPPVHVHPAVNMGEAALVACLQVVRLCWTSLLAHATSANADASAAPAPAGAVVAHAPSSDAAAVNPLHTTRFTLEHYLAPHAADGLHRLYEDLSWQSGRAAAAAVAASVAGGGARMDDPLEEENEAVRVPGPHVHRHTPIAGDAHLTLLLHALVAEVAAVDATGRAKFASTGSQAYGQEPGQNLSAEWLGSLARRVLVKRFWNDAQRFIAADRIPKLLFARAQLGASASFGSGGTGMTTGASTPGGFGLGSPGPGGDHSASRKLGREIHVVFDLYASLAWFQYAVQPPRLDYSSTLTAEPVLDTRVQRRTQREWVGLRKWFAAIVDGFVDTLVEEIGNDIAEIFGSAPPVPAASPPNGQRASSSSAVRAPLTSLKDVMVLMDTRLTQLLRKPATRAHKRVLVDALARLATAYAEARLLQSSAPPPPPDQPVPSPASANGAAATPRRAGLVEELHIRHNLNRLYQLRYPPGMTGAADKEGRSAPTAPTEREPKPEHKFGYDPVLPRVCAATVRQLNELRVANVKVAQLLLVGGGGGSGGDAADAALAGDDDPAGSDTSVLLSPSSSPATATATASAGAGAATPLRRGFYSGQIRSLLVQSLSFLAESLCAIVVPATVSNLLRMSPAGTGSNRWPPARVEKCLGESLGFLYEHVEALKALRIHQDLLRELGLFVLLEYADAFAAEMRNVSRVASPDGVVYYKPREVERLLVKDQLLRLAEALKLVKAFVADVCQVPEHWFESTFPRGVDPGAGAASGSASAVAGANAYGSGKGASRHQHQQQSPPPLAQLLGVGPYAPKNLVPDAKGSSVIAPPAPYRGYTVPPSWGAATTALTELWKVERLLVVMLAPSLALATLYASHVEPGTAAPGAAAAAAAAELGLGLVLGAGAAGDESDDEADAEGGGGDDSAQGATPSRRGSRRGSFQLQAGGHFLAPPSRHSPAHSTADATAAPASSSGLPHFPASSLPLPGPILSATEPLAPPHPFLLLGLSRWDIYRVMQSRARFVDDSFAAEWLGKTSKPPKNRDAAEPPTTGLLGKIGSWFGGSSPSPPPPQAPKEKEKPKKPRSTKLFGGPLGEAIKDNAPQAVPRVVDECVRFLRGCALDEPGLFRIAGNKDAVDALRARYDEAFQADDPARLPRLTEVHDAAGVFKLYYRSMVEPLIPFDFYARFIKVGLNKGDNRVSQMKELVDKLPKENFVMLSHLFSFLSEVAAHSDNNKMVPDNLAIVFAPNLIRPKVETAQTMMADMAASISVIATCIANYREIFNA